MNASEHTKSAELLALRPLPKFTSQGDLLRYVERTRRQLDRFDQLPGAAGNPIDPEAEAHIRKMCDELEADIFMGLPSD